jgi:hypothetical protein
MFRSVPWIAAAAAVSLLAGPAAQAQEQPRPVPTVAAQGGGTGIPAGAPAAVKERIAAFLAAAAAGERRTPQRAGRRSWTGCRTVYAWRGYNNPLGMSLFRYYQQVSWCSNGFSIYSWSRERWPEISGPGWRFDGHIGSSLGGPSTEKHAWTQGSFTGCMFGYCQTKVPWISITVRVDGGYSWNTGD